MQTIVIKKMVADLNIPIDIVIVPTMREHDGLAMSSRNVYLSTEDRAAAPSLYKALQAGEALFEKHKLARGSTGSPTSPLTASALGDCVRGVLERQERFSDIDYVSVSSLETMRELPDDANLVAAEVGGAVVSVAVRIGDTRLIDNVLLQLAK